MLVSLLENTFVDLDSIAYFCVDENTKPHPTAVLMFKCGEKFILNLEEGDNRNRAKEAIRRLYEFSVD